MVLLQNFPTLQFDFINKTKTVKVTIDFMQNANCFTRKILTDLENFFNWLPHHLEVAAVVITSNQTTFGSGLSASEWQKLSSDDLGSFLKRIQQLIHATFFLPQIIIIDIKKGAQNICAELAVGADIRLARHDALLQFNHLQQGLTPCSGGIGMLSALIGKSHAKNWILGGHPIAIDELKESGFIHHIYTDDGSFILNNLLQQISKQAPIQRIQAKRAFLETIIKDLDATLTYETSIGNAALFGQDWREALLAQQETRSPKFSSPSNILNFLKHQSTHQCNS